MHLTLEKASVKSTAFAMGSTVEFQIGYLLDETGRKVFRYTRSMKPVRAHFRITLQYESDEEHTPYVFDIVKPQDATKLLVNPENEPSKKIWTAPASPPYQELLGAIELIYKADIEPA